MKDVKHLLLFLAAAALLVSSACRSEPATPAESEFDRHLRQGREQMRSFLYESARAELDKCNRIDPEHPDLWFDRARLALFGHGRSDDRQTATELLERLVEADPGSVRAHRLLFEIAVRGNDLERAAKHQIAVERAAGDVGGLEMNLFARYLGGKPLAVRFDEAELAGASPDLAQLARAFSMLERRGGYSPSEAVRILEEVLARYPELALIRFHYAKTLIEREVRVDFSPRPDLPPMSSRVIADYAQAHFERVLDLVFPGTALAADTLLELSDIALRMADYDEAVKNFDILLPITRDGSMQRSLLGQKGLARFKQRRYAEATRLLEAALLGTDPTSWPNLAHLWLLHVAYEEGGTPAVQRRFPFAFRKDLALPGTPTSMSFEDVAPRLKLNKLDGLGPSAWGDVDRDGDLDLYVSGADSYGALYLNDGDTFTDVSSHAGLLHAQSGFSSTFADYDNDGWPDLYVGRDGWNGPARNSLYHNEGGGVFEDVTEHAGVGHPGSSFVHAWTDYDRDGDIDLYVANGITGAGDTNVLYRNEGDGTFTDVTEEAGLAEPAGTKTIGVALGDYDKDGWPDIFVSGFATANRLYRNNGDGTFEEVAAKAGVADEQYISAGYVCFFFDFDNDTLPDILRTSLAPWPAVLTSLSEKYDRLPEEQRKQMLKDAPRLHRNNGDGTFSDVTVAAGFTHPIGIMGANVADLDNDGYTDVYFGTGDPQIGRLEADRFYRNNGDGTFTDLTFAVGLGNTGKGHGVTFLDLDADGDLEIYAPEGGFWHGDPYPNALYLNGQTTGHHWLHVDLEGRESNRDAVGAKLTLAAEDLRVYREVHGGRGFGSSDSPTIEFGLGRATRVDWLEIVWPSGLTQSFRDLPADRRIFIEEGGDVADVAPPGG